MTLDEMSNTLNRISKSMASGHPPTDIQIQELKSVSVSLAAASTLLEASLSDIEDWATYRRRAQKRGLHTRWGPGGDAKAAELLNVHRNTMKVLTQDHVVM